jgi:hypothetical protein
MPRARPSSPDPPLSHARALLRWDDEGGALSEGPQKRAGSTAPEQRHAPRLNDAELVPYRVQLIALENLLAALLAERPARQAEIALAMAACVSPKPGLMDHPLILHAASRLIDGVERSSRARPDRAAGPSPADGGGPDG